MTTALVRNAERMMTAAGLVDSGIECTFADGASGLIPYANVPEIESRSAAKELELPNAYEMIVTLSEGQRVEIPWDFARHYCDRTYRPTIEAIAVAGRKTLGDRIRQHRESRGLTQDQLSQKAEIGRVTLARLENGGQTPRFKTLTSIARALEVDVDALLVDS
jgi:DNA-binding XRE family transcriptional regulator